MLDKFVDFCVNEYLKVKFSVKLLVENMQYERSLANTVVTVHKVFQSSSMHWYCG